MLIESDGAISFGESSGRPPGLISTGNSAPDTDFEVTFLSP